MVELLMAMTVMAIALTALVVVFTSGQFAMRSAGQATTAEFLADAQMETYRAMTSRDIGLDLSASTIAALDSNYTDDAACANPSTGTTCAVNGVAGTETGPTGTDFPDSCTTINTWYSNTYPCDPSRIVDSSSTPASPDGRSYRIDTYIVQLAAVTSGTIETAQKEVTVVVRDGTDPSHVFAREASVFDCSTGITPDSTDC